MANFNLHQLLWLRMGGFIYYTQNRAKQPQLVNNCRRATGLRAFVVSTVTGHCGVNGRNSSLILNSSNDRGRTIDTKVANGCRINYNFLSYLPPNSRTRRFI